ncbi:MAG: DUF3800 domain-containing protein [Gammaproteobacteria bacterium]|nr:DUF3800 domain-containing protein [Gammaproteobacteria bacterium]
MYTVGVDESGDVGLENVRPDPSCGPTQYFCMAATIFQEENRPEIEMKLKELPFSRNLLHANRLSHFGKVHLCRTIAELPVGIVGVISNKITLLTYLDDAKRTPTHFYNKVTQYLLERIGEVVSSFGLGADRVRILLEARAQRYSSLLSFVESIQKTPLDSRSLPIRNINRFSISAVKKAEDSCMVISDIAAHAIFSSVRRDGRFFGLSETRYLRELSAVLISDKRGRVVPKGIKPIHSVRDLGLPPSEAEFLRALSNPNTDYHRLAP